MPCKYDHEYKVQAVKMAKEIGVAKELGILEKNIYIWLKAVRVSTVHTPERVISLAKEFAMLCKRVKD